MIKVVFNKACGRCTQSEPLTSGMVGQTIQFEYSSDFDGLKITAVFTNGKKTVDVLDPGAECVIPHEVLETAGAAVKVGVYAVKGNELVIPTVYASIGVVLPGADPGGDVEADPTLPIWAQLQAMIGDLSDLETEAKDNLVAAINEAAQTGGGGGGGTATAASVAMRVEGGYIQYTANNKTWTNLIAVADLKGAKGDKGADGVPGKDGVDGKDGAPGKDGVDGHTPVKGVDYWTAADKSEIVESTKEAIDLTAYAKTSGLAAVAISGSYNDLADKPAIPTVPTNVSSFTNDAGYLTLATLPKYEGAVE